MKIQYHLEKISWALLDKMLFIVFGIVNLLQISIMETIEFGLFTLFIQLNSYIFILSDSFALQNIIHFGAVESNRGKVNLSALIIHTSIVMTVSGLIYFLGDGLAMLFHSDRFIEVTAALPLLSFLMIFRSFIGKILVRDHLWKKIFFTDLVFFGTMSGIILFYKYNSMTMDFETASKIYYLGAFLSSILMIGISLKQLELSFKGDIKVRDMINFSIPFTLTAALSYIPKYLDVFIIQFTFRSTEIVGVYQAAKNLFRVFDEGINAANGLIYPAAVRNFEKKDYNALYDIVTKSVSFMFIAYIGLIFLLEIGLSKMIIEWFLPITYQNSIPQFNIMLIAAAFLPFTVLFYIALSSGKYWKLFRIVAISTTFSIMGFIAAGYLENELLAPLGLIIYNFVNCLLLVLYVRNEIGLPIKFSDLFRAISDSLNFLKKKIK